MRKHVLIYGLLGGALIALLKVVEYRFLVVEHSVELYGGLVAALFSSLGIWLGLTLTRRGARAETREKDSYANDSYVAASPPVVAAAHTTGGVDVASSSVPFAPNLERRDTLGITKRELEILELIAAGLSNREIAERIYVSENTVKTHVRSVLAKLGVQSRTQAALHAHRIGLGPLSTQ